MQRHIPRSSLMLGSGTVRPFGFHSQVGIGSFSGPLFEHIPNIKNGHLVNAVGRKTKSAPPSPWGQPALEAATRTSRAYRLVSLQPHPAPAAAAAGDKSAHCAPHFPTRRCGA